MITPRLNCILSHITAKTIADIGTDHAYIPIKLVQTGRISSAIASDIRIGPVRIARANIQKYCFTDKIEVRMGPGLEPIHENEAEEIIIAGMGGILIGDILKAGETTAKSAQKLILQPMNCQYELRKFLISNGYTILKEDLAVEGNKVYNILEAQNGICDEFHTDFEYHIPNSLLNHPYILNLLKKKHREFLKIYTGLKNSVVKRNKDIQKYEQLLTELLKIREENLHENYPHY